MKQALQDNSISPCLVDDYRYLNKGIPNFFDYNIKDKNEAKERQDEKENLKAEIEKDKQDSNELKHSEIDTKDTQVSEPLETLDKDKQAMSEAIKKDIEKDKENLARVEADKDEKGYEKDDDKKAQKLDKEIAKNYGACVDIGERRRLGDISTNAIKNYNILCKKCADEVLLEAFKKSFIEAVAEAKNEIDNGKLYHTQKFKFPFYGCVDRSVAISLAKSYTYDFTTNEIKEVLIIDKINCNLISKANKFTQGLSNEN
ncbi:hypothetical protein MPG49_07640 [Helicobacter pylori]|nr:hypothetical protein [Helicobacter pylori]UOS71693.1 hypothetical protein MPG49_07640 [Helicobacter pylori]